MFSIEQDSLRVDAQTAVVTFVIEQSGKRVEFWVGRETLYGAEGPKGTPLERFQIMRRPIETEAARLFPLCDPAEKRQILLQQFPPVTDPAGRDAGAHAH